MLKLVIIYWHTRRPCADFSFMRLRYSFSDSEQWRMLFCYPTLMVCIRFSLYNPPALLLRTIPSYSGPRVAEALAEAQIMGRKKQTVPSRSRFGEARSNVSHDVENKCYYTAM